MITSYSCFYNFLLLRELLCSHIALCKIGDLLSNSNKVISKPSPRTKKEGFIGGKILEFKVSIIRGCSKMKTMKYEIDNFYESRVYSPWK